MVSLAQDAKAGNHVVVPFAKMDEIGPVVETTGFTLPGAAAEWHHASRRQRTDSIVLTVIPFALFAAATGWIGSRIPDVPAAWPGLAAIGLAAVGTFLSLREWHLWRHRRHALERRQLFVHQGWLAPRLDIASPVRLQSVEIAQGPLARRRGYAHVKFGVAGGSLDPHAPSRKHS